MAPPTSDGTRRQGKVPQVKIKSKEPYEGQDRKDVYKRQIGALALYVSNESVTDFQPMNINFGIMPPWAERVKGGKREKNTLIANRALAALPRV